MTGVILPLVIRLRGMRNTNSQQPGWRDLYKAAVLEFDPVQLSRIIAQAEIVIARRKTELLQDFEDHIQEERDLSDAVYGLKAL
jgi:hypothetical protein